MNKKVSFQLLVELRRAAIVREENEIEKNENESEDGVVEHSKVQALESRKICQKFWAYRDLKGVGEWQLQMSG